MAVQERLEVPHRRSGGGPPPRSSGSARGPRCGRLPSRPRSGASQPASAAATAAAEARSRRRPLTSVSTTPGDGFARQRQGGSDRRGVADRVAPAAVDHGRDQYGVGLLAGTALAAGGDQARCPIRLGGPPRAPRSSPRCRPHGRCRARRRPAVGRVPLRTPAVIRPVRRPRSGSRPQPTPRARWCRSRPPSAGRSPSAAAPAVPCRSWLRSVRAAGLGLDHLLHHPGRMRAQLREVFGVPVIGHREQSMRAMSPPDAGCQHRHAATADLDLAGALQLVQHAVHRQPGGAGQPGQVVLRERDRGPS